MQTSPTIESTALRRVAAGFIDIAVLSGVMAAMASRWGTLETDGGISFALEGGPGLAFMAVALAYYAGFEVLVRSTPGKLLLGLTVASATDRPLTIGRLLARNAPRVIDGLPVLYLVGVVVMAVTPRRQRVGDLAADTVVVRRHQPYDKSF